MGLSPKLTYPVLGNQVSLKVKKYRRTAPSRKMGTETPTMASTMRTLSASRPARIALIDPSTIETTSQMIPAGTTSDRVTGNLSLN